MRSLRKCRMCGLEAHTEKDLELFVKGKDNKYGRRNICFICHRECSRKYHKENREYISRYLKEKYKNDEEYRERIKKKTKERQQKHYNTDNNTAYSTKRRRKLKVKFLILLGEKCELCDEKNPVCLEFHHVNANDKTNTSYHQRSTYFEKLIREGKIRLLCSNHHKLEHHYEVNKEMEQLMEEKGLNT